MTTLSPTLRRALRARAHMLSPVVSISSKGLTEPVIAEIERALEAHELIKVRTYGVERAERGALLARIGTALGAAPVQLIGNVIVLFRERRNEAEVAPAPAAPARRAAKPKQRRRQAAAGRVR